jgi:hypothetical protein|tara:strand:+ start:262 stop:450 length:189 start_codon:yes stop_codon:yes gene_type:complete
MSKSIEKQFKHIAKNIFPLIESITSSEPGPDIDPEFLELLEDLREIWQSDTTQEIIEFYENM